MTIPKCPKCETLHRPEYPCFTPPAETSTAVESATPCDICGGVGGHRENCPEISNASLAALREQLDHAEGAEAHMAFCRALLKVPDDELLADAIKELRERDREQQAALKQKDEALASLIAEDELLPALERPGSLGQARRALAITADSSALNAVIEAATAKRIEQLSILIRAELRSTSPYFSRKVDDILDAALAASAQKAGQP